MFDAVNVNRLTLWLGLGKRVHERCSSEDHSQRSQTNERQTPDEKIRILRQADGKRTILEICAKNNISEQTFHRWKKEFGLLDVKQAKRLKELEAENTRLKRIVADQVPGMGIIQEALEKRGIRGRRLRALSPGSDAPDEKSADTSSYIARRIGMRRKNRMHGKNGRERRFGVTR